MNIFDDLAKDRIKDFKKEVVEHSRRAVEAWANGRNEYGYLCSDLMRVDDFRRDRGWADRDELKDFIFETYKESEKEYKEGEFKNKDCHVKEPCLDMIFKLLRFISYDYDKWDYDDQRCVGNGQSITIENSVTKNKFKINFDYYGKLVSFEQIEQEEG